MKIKLIVTGKTGEECLEKLTKKYISRIKNFIPFECVVIPALKNTKKMPQKEQQIKEGNLILEKLSPSDYVILLDERGKEFTSAGFAREIQKRMNSGIKNLVFIIGGPYGFSGEVYKRANQKLSLSKMTFSHQLIRLIFAEQLYRAFTIINHHPYHHE